MVENVVKGRYKNRILTGVVEKAAYAYRKVAYRNGMLEIKDRNLECWNFLERLGKEKWSKANFVGDRNNLMTTKMVDPINATLMVWKDTPILETVRRIVSTMSEWFGDRHQYACQHGGGGVTPAVLREMARNLEAIRVASLRELVPKNVEVAGLCGEKHIAMLGHRKCQCGEYDKLKIPCGHALVGAPKWGVDVEELVGQCYKTSMWRQTYEGVIHTVAEHVHGYSDASTQLHPPLVRASISRPRLSR
ncbi:uncharacterized protein LOC112089295 [Eutrema salsugineum]|uniref:uncharacterized protein LOC112089295 n=1 Tax=Eutrema salsugineum TaxID=72664 RepID=UPI000CED2E1B|nr:uncharacterized protein LOC112089295 [Eutrema salsugineum]